MKVQLQTNYTNRNLTQKTNGTQACAKPNFARTWEVSGPTEQISPLFLRGVEMVLESFKPTSITKGEIVPRLGMNPITYIKASYPQEVDEKVLRALEASLHHEPDAKIYFKDQHSLTPGDLDKTFLGDYFSPFHCA